jgi:hypothetical protein
VTVRLGHRQSFPESVHVQPQLLGSAVKLSPPAVRLSLSKPSSLAVNRQKALTERPVELRKGTAQVGAGVGLAAFRPQKRCQCITAVRSSRHREIRQKRYDLAAADLDRLTVELDAWRAEQV